MRWRILKSTLIVVAITSLVLGVPLALACWRLVEDFTRADLRTRLEQAVVQVDDQSPPTPTATDLRSVGRTLPPNGQLVVDSPRTGRLVLGSDPGPGAVVESLPLGQRGTARLAVPGDVMRSDQMRVVAMVGLLVALPVGIGAAIATVTARRLAEPLQDVADRAARLGAGDFRLEPARHGIPELDRVAELLDTSAAALAELVQRERDLVGDVSHQLRSRLTALQLRLDELAGHPDPATAAEAEAALEQAERLGAVLDDLVRATEEARAATAEPVALAELLGEVVADWQAQADAERRALRLRVADGLVARVTPGRLREAIGVLIDNALRHGAGVVTLSARPGGVGPDRMIVVEVTDGGEGVPEELAPHVFIRGVSGASSTGVGLALARALVEADGGRLELSSARPARFAAYLRVPRGEEPAASPRPGIGVVR
ncbi:MAG TPA: HAMP domain-containing sensor histidine kinase [Pseudonocardiaceae bacterium]|nr:HAMP domain-containing sensor histidine kinase [Pseudonocardiaceae bacterium]